MKRRRIKKGGKVEGKERETGKVGEKRVEDGKVEGGRGKGEE